MNLKEAILKEHSKAQCTKIVKWVGSSQQRFDELFALFSSAEYRVVQRAAWPVSYCVIANPALINKHWKKLIQNLKQNGVHHAVKRNTVRFLQELDIPEKYEGELMNICFEYAASPTEEIAVKCFSLTVLYNLSKKYPEILSELKTVIEQQLPYASPAFKSRAQKIFRQF